MKLFSFLIVLSFSLQYAWSQTVLNPKLSTSGLKYPVVRITSNPNAEKKINDRIEEQVKPYEASDFCVGDYGYVVKGMHLQVHLLINCIEMKESEHHYLLFNMETGEIVEPSDLFDAKQRENALAFIQKKLAEYIALGPPCQEAYQALGSTPNWDKMDIRLTPNGLEIRPIGTKACEKNALKIAWTEVFSLLKYNFI